MRPHRESTIVARLRGERLCRELFQLAFVLAVVLFMTGHVAYGADKFQRSPRSSGSSAAGSTTGSAGQGVAAPVGSTIDTAVTLQQRAAKALQRSHENSRNAENAQQNAINASRQMADNLAKMRERAIQSIKRTDASLAAFHKAQKDARTASGRIQDLDSKYAKLPDVADGLNITGLEVLADPSALWQGAEKPTQKDVGTSGGKEVTVVQNDQNALLTWKTFNIGKNTTLTFDQSKGAGNAGTWIAFNYVKDPTANPTQILGALRTIGAADPKGNVPTGGQVYVLNPNGILFGPNSQVKLHGLVASTLPLNEKLVNSTTQSILANPLQEFQFTVPQIDKYGETVAGATAVNVGDVKVFAGAEITAPTNADSQGGRVTLLGGNVENNGRISTPDGQTVIAAGQQVAVLAHASTDASLRGLDVYVGEVGDGQGSAVNKGIIEVPRGNATMVGKQVDQMGAIDSTTSVATNGRIDLDASYGSKNPNYNKKNDPKKISQYKAGEVNLGANSVTRILPEWGSADTVVGSTLSLISQVNIRGHNINFAGQTVGGLASGAYLYAPSAFVNISAGDWSPKFEGPYVTGTEFGPIYAPGTILDKPDKPENVPTLIPGGGQITISDGAVIDVSGTAGDAPAQAWKEEGLSPAIPNAGATAKVSDNVVKVELRAAELANFPVQRDGALRGQTVYVDIRQTGTRADGTDWIGTPLADASGWAGLAQHTVGQLTTSGGKVSLKAGGSVVVQKAASVNVAGGYIDYTSGEVKTTKLIDNGRVIDISQASPERKYDGIYTAGSIQKDDQGRTVSTGSGSVKDQYFQPGYQQGGAGGSLSITSPVMALHGALHGERYAGPWQRASGTWISDSGPWQASAPELGKLALRYEAQAVWANDKTAVLRQHTQLKPFEPTSPSVIFGTSTDELQDGNKMPILSGSENKLYIPVSWFGASNFGAITVDNTRGNILLPAGVTLAGITGGSFVLNGGNIRVDGSIVVPSGYLDFSAYNLTENQDLGLSDAGTRGLGHYFKLADSVDGRPSLAMLAPDGDRGSFFIGKNALMDVSGLIVDNRIPESSFLPSVTKGGSVAVSGYNMIIEDSELTRRIDVSGGITVGSTGKISYGNGGNILIAGGTSRRSMGKALEANKLTAYLDGLFASKSDGTAINFSNFASTLWGYSGAVGGKIEIQGPQVRITKDKGEASTARSLVLGPDFFRTGGFSSYTVRGQGYWTETPGKVIPGISVLSGTEINPAQEFWRATFDPTGELEIIKYYNPEQGLLNPIAVQLVSQGYAKNDPNSHPIIARENISISLRGDLILDGDLKISEFVVGGKKIPAAPKSSVTIIGDVVKLGGQIVAPGGTITVSGADKYNDFNTSTRISQATVVLESTATLDVSGLVLRQPEDARGYRTGTAVNGGTISIAGNIVAETGSRLDVSGATGFVDLLPEYSGRNDARSPLSATKLVQTYVSSNGGSIKLKGSELLVFDASMSAAAGDSSARAGQFDIISDTIWSDTVSEIARVPDKETLTVSASSPESNIFAYFTGDANAKIPASLGGGFIGADKLYSAGFDRIVLGGSVKFDGKVDLSAKSSLDVGGGGVVFANDEVTLTAPAIHLGQSLRPPDQPGQLSGSNNISSVYVSILGTETKPYYFEPKYGTGSLKVAGDKLIEFGYLSLQNIGVVDINSRFGEVRGNGTVDFAGNATITAKQIYPTTGGNFTIAVQDYSDANGSHDGTLTINRSGVASSLPLSAAGTLSLYASQINSNGTLRAPFGTINIGWNSNQGTGPKGDVTNILQPKSKKIVLGSDSLTTVSAIDPNTGKGWTLPYGLIADGITWVDPRGIDITAEGLPQKHVNISADSIDQKSGATIDLRGGGELLAYRWVKGNNGTKDVLASTESFAIVPGYSSDFAPYAAYNTTVAADKLFKKDTGYVNSELRLGDRIHIDASAGYALLRLLDSQNQTPALDYTLLPARYALLPGAVLVTPKTGLPPDSPVKTPEGAFLVSGYRFNGLNSTPPDNPLYGTFELAPQKVVQARAQYDLTTASKFFAGSTSVPLPADSAQLVLSTSQSLLLNGALQAQAGVGGRGAMIDIDVAGKIAITSNPTGVPSGNLVLDPAALSSFQAGSLLIGGLRSGTADNASVTVSAESISLDNAGTPLTGSDVALVATQGIELAADSDLNATGSDSGAGTFNIGNSTTIGSGNGVAVRVSNNSDAAIVRNGVGTVVNGVPTLTLAPNAQLGGNSAILDTSHSADLSADGKLSASTLTVSSDRLAVVVGNSTEVPSTGSLELGGDLLANLGKSSERLSLQGYSSIDLFGAGTLGGSNMEGLLLHTASIRSWDKGAITLSAKAVTIDNLAGTAPSGAINPGSATLSVKADTISLGKNTTALQGFKSVNMEASRAILATAEGGLLADSDLRLQSPLVTGLAGSTLSVDAKGTLSIGSVGNSGVVDDGQLGAKLEFRGSNILTAGTIRAHSGTVSLQSTNDLIVGGVVDVSGWSKAFNDVLKYTSGGTINLKSEKQSISLSPTATLNISAKSGGGDAGSMAVSAAAGTFTQSGVLAGQAGLGGRGGSFTLDVKSVDAQELSGLWADLADSGFNESLRTRIRTGNVNINSNSTVMAKAVSLAADAGSITIEGKVDVSGKTGGTIDISASGSVTVASGGSLLAVGDTYDAAGKGGAIYLAAGSYKVDSKGKGASDSTATIALQAGSTIDLSVKSKPATVTIQGTEVDLGQRSGKLQLRSPKDSASNTILAGAILNASSISLEGFKVYELNDTSKAITTTQENSVKQDGTSFGNGSTYNTLLGKLTASNPGYAADEFHLLFGAEIVNNKGDLTLDHTWNLSTYRFGTNMDPGVLTLRAAGDLVFQYNTSSKTYGSLSDGFTGGTANRGGLVDASLMSGLSWSYRLVSGADFGGANFRGVTQIANPDTSKGSIEIGRNSPALPATGTNNDRYNASMVPKFYQTIRTGTGDIDMVAAGNVRLLNNLATVYTAGELANAIPGFDIPILAYPALTVAKPEYFGFNQTPAKVVYAVGGGNVSIAAGGDIKRQKLVGSSYLPDSSLEMPTNWLYRRGLVDPATGLFASRLLGNTAPSGGRPDEVMSTTWWVDYTNFYEGVGALGGGNITLSAGRDISNVDALVPTNARMPGRDSADSVLAPNASQLVELGGGSITAAAGRNLDAGVYYVERGHANLTVGNSVVTNDSRNVVNESKVNPAALGTSLLPTTFFLGKGDIKLAAGGDVLLGAVANIFLLPAGINNMYYNQTYFNTYDSTGKVDFTSLRGSIAVRNPDQGTAAGNLSNWFKNKLYWIDNSTVSLSRTYPWLRMADYYDRNAGSPPGYAMGLVQDATSLLPPEVSLVSFAGDISVLGNLNLMPSAQGNLEILAAGAMGGFGKSGLNGNIMQWQESRINLSDADPSRFPSIVSPADGTGQSIDKLFSLLVVSQKTNPLAVFNTLITELAKSNQTLASKLALHGENMTRTDADPLRIYALGGDISGLTLFSGKASKIQAANDITDIAFYLQNNSVSDISVVAAGRDIVAYQEGSALRSQLGTLDQIATKNNAPKQNAGDIQIAGPGIMQVFAGRNLDLGNSPANKDKDGIGMGLLSIGNERNPALPEQGASILAMAGVGYQWKLQGTDSQFDSAIDNLLNPKTTGSQSARYLPLLGKLMDKADTASDAVWSAFEELPISEKRKLAASLMRAANLGAASGAAESAADWKGFVSKFLDPATAGAQAQRNLPILATIMGMDSKAPASQIWAAFNDPKLTDSQRAANAVATVFYVLRDAGRDYTNPDSPLYRDKKYPNAYQAIATLFPGALWEGNISLTSRAIKTSQGGDLQLFTPGGGLLVGLDGSGSQAQDQGIFTARGGSISIFANNSVSVGTSRIFTLRGGNEIIWSSKGDIAAGASSKTVLAAPPTRVIIDPQSADVKPDLAGLATGGGIGVLASRKGVAAGDVDLIAPVGTVDAGDAGIRSSGNLNIAAQQIANAANIATGGTTSGVPPVTVPSISVPNAPTTKNTDKETQKVTSDTGTKGTETKAELPSLIEVKVIGYGGGKADDEEEDKEKQKDGDVDSAKGASPAQEAKQPQPAEQAAVTPGDGSA